MFSKEEDEFYRTEPAKVLQSIGREETERLFSDPELELGLDFIGFLAVYADLKELPKDFTIIDIGCNMAFQGDYFKEHERYIGVDSYQPEEWRLRQDNADYYTEMGQAFIQETLPKLIERGLDLEKTMAICSYVPDKELQQMVAETFPYHRVQYCDDMISEKYPAGFEPHKLFSEKEAKEKPSKENSRFER